VPEPGPAEPPSAAFTAIRPNPFLRSTTIGYVSTRTAPVRLGVYDLGGARVRRLVPGPTEPGRHEVVWDGRDDSGAPVRPGIYFCVLQTSGARAVERLVRLQ
jgi:hypothetical protein